MKIICLLIAVIVSVNVIATEKYDESLFIFPVADKFELEKRIIIKEINEVTEGRNPIQLLRSKNKFIFWANQANIFPKKENNVTTYETVDQASFTPTTTQNIDQHKKEIEKQCHCKVDVSRLAGILIAHPYIAAEMYLRLGWAGVKTEKVDGYAPPIVIAYHELVHLGDFLRNKDFFFDSAGIFSRQWKNKAEESACQGQNDFVRQVYLKKRIKLDLRSSYGKNKYFKVSDIYSVVPINKND